MKENCNFLEYYQTKSIFQIIFEVFWADFNISLNIASLAVSYQNGFSHGILGIQQPSWHIEVNKYEIFSFFTLRYKKLLYLIYRIVSTG